MAEVLYQRWSFLNVGVFQWPLVQTFSSLICFRWKFPSLLHRGLRQRMICYCWYVTNFGDQLGLTTNAALQKEWSHQLALWISYQGNGDDDHQNITEYHLVFTKKQIKNNFFGGWGGAGGLLFQPFKHWHSAGATLWSCHKRSNSDRLDSQRSPQFRWCSPSAWSPENAI